MSVGAGVGCGVGVLIPNVGDAVIVLPTVITVANGGTNPASSPLYAGQTLSQFFGHGTWTQITNFGVSDVTDSIALVELQRLTGAGWETDTGLPVAEGEILQTRVQVTSTKGVVALFPMANQTVQYRFRATMMGTTVVFDLNPLVPDTETIIFTVTGQTGVNAHLNDTYAMLAGEIRATSAVPGTARILYTGLLADLTTGDDLTLHDGLFVTVTGAGTVTRQLSRGATPLTTLITYTLVDLDLGETLSLVPSIDDGVNPPVPADPVTIDIPAPPASGIVFHFYGSDDDPGNADHIPNSDLTVGRQQIVLLASRSQNVNRHIDGFSVDGGGTQPLAYQSTGVAAARANEDNQVLVKAAFGLHTATATTHTYAIVNNDTAIQSLVGIVELETAVTFSVVEYSDAADATPELSIDVLAGDVVLGLFNFDAGANDKTLGAGFTDLVFSNGNADMRTVLASHVVTADEVGRVYGVNAVDADDVTCMLIRMRSV